MYHTGASIHYPSYGMHAHCTNGICTRIELCVPLADTIACRISSSPRILDRPSIEDIRSMLINIGGAQTIACSKDLILPACGLAACNSPIPEQLLLVVLPQSTHIKVS